MLSECESSYFEFSFYLFKQKKSETDVRRKEDWIGSENKSF